MARQFVQQAELTSFEDDVFKLRVPSQGLVSSATLDKLKAALAGYFGRPVRVAVAVGVVQGATAAAVEEGERSARHASAVAAIESDPFVQALVKDFGATVVPGSIKPV